MINPNFDILLKEARDQERNMILNLLEQKRARYEQMLKASTSCFDEYDHGLIEGKECFCIILQEWISELRSKPGES